MSVFVSILFVIIIVMLTIYIILTIVYKKSGNTYVLSRRESLQAKKEVLYADETQKQLLGGSGSTVMGFFKLESGDRTVKYVDSFIPIMQVDNNWYIEISPAPVGKDKVSARLRVQTNDGTCLKQEIVELPDIPKQKWVFIAILREGRRFDVIYDNQMVASQRLESYPVVISSPLSVGNKGLSGSVIHIVVNGRRLSPSEVEKERSTKISTDNTVLEFNSLDVSFPSLNLFAKCPPGLPCDPITKPPKNNLMEWNSPYA